jgi:hypothetical protein
MRAILPILLVSLALSSHAAPQTVVSIEGDKFLINGELTYEGRVWNGHSIEGLLMNARLVQATFDDFNPETVSRWAYPDTGKWDAERNVSEFIAAMPEWRAHGMLAFTVNFQGGSPEGYSRTQPWENNAFEPDGSLRPAYADRMRRVIERADELGMVVILGYFYFGQDQRLADETAVIRAVDEATRWVLSHGWRNVIIEINNECDVGAWDHEILKPARVHELIERVRAAQGDDYRLLAGTSFKGGSIPTEKVVRASDFLLIHGNGVSDPTRIAAMVRETRAVTGSRGQPIVFNEDDHYDFDKPLNNFTAAVSERAGWGFFDFRRRDEAFDEGFQSVPVNWRIRSDRKKGFFQLLAEITGHDPAKRLVAP